nr:hypothetical protein [Tanacetum cinerariifolium]
TFGVPTGHLQLGELLFQLADGVVFSLKGSLHFANYKDGIKIRTSSALRARQRASKKVLATCISANRAYFQGLDEYLSWLLVVEKRDVTTADRNDIIWLMASMGSSPCLNTKTVRPESSWGNSAYFQGLDEYLSWLLVVEKRDVTTADRNDIIWLMASMGSSPCLNTKTVRPESSWGNSVNGLQPKKMDLSCVHALNELHLHEIRIVPKVLIIDKAIHTVKTDIVTFVVKIKSFGMSSDKFDKETRSSDRLQPKQADLSCVYAVNKLHFHEIHVVPSKHKADQY